MILHDFIFAFSNFREDAVATLHFSFDLFCCILTQIIFGSRRRTAIT